MEPQRIIQAILALHPVDERTLGAARDVSLPLDDETQSVRHVSAISRESVGQAIGVTLQEEVAQESPTTKFFRSDGEGGFSLVLFQFAKNEPIWLLTCIYNLERTQHPASSVAWDMFGPCIRKGLLPTMSPEGCSAYEFSYSGLIITFHVTVQSKLVYSVKLKHL